MKHVICTVITLLGFISTFVSIATEIAPIEPVRTFPSLPQLKRETKFNEVQTRFEERSNLFLKGKHFHNWTPNKPQAAIVEEFKQISEWRHHTWFSERAGETLISRQDFMIAQDLLEKGLYRRPHLIAFQYNQTDGSYNSSTIILNGYRFLALEAPTLQHTPAFFKLLQNHRVTQLVRLTPASEQGIERSAPYWINRLKSNTQKNHFLHIPIAGSRRTLPVRYYAMDTWLDHQGVDPAALLKLITRVRAETDPNNGLLACHCRCGVGRTGTFIAGYLLLQEIDKQLAAGIKKGAVEVSIEKIVMQLSLQRFYMVARVDQYLTLYRLVDLYLNSKKP